jgi:GH15 family glucan-1,4-alpha-glucosidase
LSLAPESFAPIGSYGFLSDCHTAALVSPDGSVEWLCLPRFDSPSAFGSMLDLGAGHWKLAPVGELVPISRRYEPGTLVIETTWVTPSGWCLVRDALTIGQWTPSGESSGSRPETGHNSDRSLLRTVTCIDGEVELEMECAPRFDYGREPAAWELGGFGEAMARDGDMAMTGDTARSTCARAGAASAR